MNTIPLNAVDLVLAAALLIVNGIISVVFGLRLERSLAIAAIRMVVQLAVVGYVLKFVFEQTSPVWTALVALVMVLVAGIELIQRQERRPRGWLAYGLGNATLLLAGGLATLYAATIVIGPSPWYAPRYVTRLQALSGLLRQSLRTATTPLLNSMAVAGVVTLPGMMAGQILAGADPHEAAKYQIMILFVLAGASGLGAFAAALGSVFLMTDARHRLRLDRLAGARRGANQHS
jgi:putative ABC transport system permease protein